MEIITKPEWLKVKAPSSSGYYDTLNLVRNSNLNTVCEEAACPNIGECWSKGHATVMILGSVCTRACRFCNVATGIPDKLDPHEPENLASAVKKLDLKHVVITSVDRDDLDDGGAHHFSRCISAIRASSPHTTIEILTPDFLGKSSAIDIIIANPPDVFNHNVETVPRLYMKIRPKANYFNSLMLLKDAKRKRKQLFTKSGLMVGLGETKEEVLQVMNDMRIADIDFITIGQYLQPTLKHEKVSEYVALEQFDYYRRAALSRGFLVVSSTPLTRSSYHAGDDFIKLREARIMRLSTVK